MTQQQGRLLLIAREDDSVPGQYNNMCGLRSRNFNLSSEEVDTTIPDCVDPSLAVQKTSIAGIADRTFSGSGKFVKNANSQAVADDARLQRAHNYKVTVPGYGSFTGLFQVTDFQFDGDMTGTLEFSATWKPTATLSFVAE